MSRPVERVLPVFIPFAGCPHRCVYCQQEVATGRSGLPSGDEVGRLIRSMLGRARAGACAGRRTEAAFFGGSFTALPPETQAEYLDAAAPFLASGEIDGVRLSTRPDAVDPELLLFLKARGVSTIELGAQSMDDAVLDRSGRGHSAGDTRRAGRTVKDHGIRLGLQMMTGLPGDSPRTAFATALQLADLAPDMVRIYPAVVLEGTALAGMWRRGEYRPWSLETTLAVLSLILPLFRSRGIGIARVGLLLDRETLGNGLLLAGPAHPAMAHLAWAATARRRMAEETTPGGRGFAAVVCHPADLSIFLGERRANLESLRREPGNRDLSVIHDEAMPRGWFDLRRASETGTDR